MATTTASPTIVTAVQQHMDSYQAAYLNNARAYHNIVAKVTEQKSGSLYKRAAFMAKAIEQERGTIPFGTLMARCERESGFVLDKPEVKVCFDNKTKQKRWCYPIDKREYPQGDSKYGVGPWQITTAWDQPNTKGYGLTKAEAQDPVLSTRAAVRELGKTHRFIMLCIPAAKQDLIFYTWLIGHSHATGPGDLDAAQRIILNGTPPSKSDPSSGLAGTCVRCQRKYNKITLGLIGNPGIAWMGAKNGAYDSPEGVRRLLISGLAAPLWERRREKLLRGDLTGLGSDDLILSALQNAKTTGQGTMLAAFKARKYSFDRAGYKSTRQELNDGAKMEAAAAREQNNLANANTVRVAQQNPVDIKDLPLPAGDIWAYDLATGVWAKHAAG